MYQKIGVVLTMLFVLAACQPKDDKYFAEMRGLTIANTNGDVVTGTSIPKITAYNGTVGSGDFDITWSVDYNSPSSTGFFEAYFSKDGTINDKYHIYRGTCGDSSIYNCNKSGSAHCVMTNNGTSITVDCGSTGGQTVAPVQDIVGASGGDASFIGRVCIYDDKVNLVCDSHTLTVNLLP